MKLASPKRILEIYYDNPFEIGNKEIKELFGTTSSSTITRLKNKARDAMIKQEKKTWDPYKVNTAIAFEAWDIDLENIEKLYKKQERLGLVKEDKTSQGKVINF